MSTYTYNKNLSEKSNRAILARKKQVEKEKRIITISFILIISVVAILCSSIKAFADSEHNNGNVTKMYKSIQIESGDTLWSIADEYNLCSDLSKEEYIREVCSLNHINENEIQSGSKLVVPYFEVNK